MFCSKCGQQIDDNARFCPSCGAPNVANTTQAQPQPQRQEAYRQAPTQAAYPQQVQPAQNAFMNFLNGTSPMKALPVISLIMFFVYGTYTFINMLTFFGSFRLPFISFGAWFTTFLSLGATVMFAIAYFKKTKKRLFFLIGLAILALLYTIALISPLWFNIVFGFFMLGCLGLIIVYYLLEGKVINDKIKLFAGLGFIFFSFIKTLIYSIYIYDFPMFFVYMIPYVALALGFLFYTPYVRRK